MELDPALNELTKEVIGAAIEVHRYLGAGFQEATYQRALEIELNLRQIKNRPQCPVKLFYKDHPVGEGRMDLLVEDRLVVELKAVERSSDLHEAQVISYLKATGYPLGLLINFNVVRLYEGVKRIIHT